MGVRAVSPRLIACSPSLKMKSGLRCRYNRCIIIWAIMPRLPHIKSSVGFGDTRLSKLTELRPPLLSLCSNGEPTMWLNSKLVPRTYDRTGVLPDLTYFIIHNFIASDSNGLFIPKLE